MTRRTASYVPRFDMYLVEGDEDAPSKDGEDDQGSLRNHDRDARVVPAGKKTKTKNHSPCHDRITQHADR